jgi:hypothetical protein
LRRSDPDNPSSIRSLARLAGNPDNKPAASNDHTTQPGAEPTLNRFASKPLALGRSFAAELPAEAAATTLQRLIAFTGRAR